MVDKFLEVPDCARMLKVHPETIRRAIHAGKLRAVKVGPKRLRIAEEDFKKYLNNMSYTLPKGGEVKGLKDRILGAVDEMSTRVTQEEVGVKITNK